MHICSSAREGPILVTPPHFADDLPMSLCQPHGHGCPAQQRGCVPGVSGGLVGSLETRYPAPTLATDIRSPRRATYISLKKKNLTKKAPKSPKLSGVTKISSGVEPAAIAMGLCLGCQQSATYFPPAFLCLRDGRTLLHHPAAFLQHVHQLWLKVLPNLQFDKWNEPTPTNSIGRFLDTLLILMSLLWHFAVFLRTFWNVDTRNKHSTQQLCTTAKPRGNTTSLLLLPTILSHTPRKSYWSFSCNRKWEVICI